MRLLQGVVNKDVNAVVAALKAKGITKFASIGWCWGASMAVQAAAADPANFKATAFLHPSMFGQEKELVGKLQCPLASFSTPGGTLLHDFMRSLRACSFAVLWVMSVSLVSACWGRGVLSVLTCAARRHLQLDVSHGQQSSRLHERDALLRMRALLSVRVSAPS
jgi:pimeloyl-ACP methyl ester carboxylesterase